MKSFVRSITAFGTGDVVKPVGLSTPTDLQDLAIGGDVFLTELTGTTTILL